MRFEELDREIIEYAPFMLSLSDSADNELTVRIAPACVGEQSEVTESDEPNAALRDILNRSRPLLPDEQRAYEITFDNYLIYQVGNESFCSGDPNDKFLGRFLRIYESSALLRHLGDFTDAQILEDGTYYPKEWAHYQIITLNHIIDVVSLSAPTVNVLPPT